MSVQPLPVLAPRTRLDQRPICFVFTESYPDTLNLHFILTSESCLILK